MRNCPRRRPGRRVAGEPAVPDEDVILRLGLQAFAELGYDGASVRELAKRLDVSHNFINDRYGSKAAFWQATVTHALARTRTDLDELVAAEMDDSCRLAAVVRAFYRSAAGSPEINRLMADESNRESERIDFLYANYLGPLLAALEPTLHRLMAAGRMRPAPPHLLFLAITGPAITLTQSPITKRLSHCSPQPTTDPEAAETLATLVLEGLLCKAPAPELDHHP
ncbi:AcrR family transcriptional regulator [Kibdelosporangium banguiense]|uniref:AcrR family transcriptional regulator n=1 Tax=Kibdelosporangium banguiense TaxID=1365924 RepID=A0ABS4TN70_9PSEU|nr:TetR/AcrR family transcriptional regulator [Kibdelosporangium banguiense]MBP2325855.1 AcrR family transcriptional regulator [Kibdelosporangium banguiense]